MIIILYLNLLYLAIVTETEYSQKTVHYPLHILLQLQISENKIIILAKGWLACTCRGSSRYMLLSNKIAIHYSTSFHVLKNFSYSGDPAFTNPNCIINLRSSLIALCSIIFPSLSIVWMCTASYETLFPVGGTKKNFPVTLAIKTTLLP